MKKAKVILLSGQSNAVGVGHIKYLPDYFDGETASKFKSGYENVLIRYISHNIKNQNFVVMIMKKSLILYELNIYTNNINCQK